MINFIKLFTDSQKLKMASSSTSYSRCKSVTIFASSYPGKNKDFAKIAIDVGNILAKESFRIIYGGGDKGLMGALATTAYVNSGNIIGIIPKSFKQWLGNTWGLEIQADNVQERIGLMYQAADAFIILPGGLETLEELACVSSWSSITMQKKPVLFLNVNGYFNSLFAFLDSAVENGFMFSDVRKLMISADSIDDILHKLRTYEHYSGHPTLQFTTHGKRKREYDHLGIDLTLSL